MPASEEGAARQRGWMRRFEHEVTGGIDERGLAPCEVSPQEEHDPVAALGNRADHGIGEFLPADAAVGGSLPRPDGQDRIEQQHYLPSPGLQDGAPAHPDGQGGLDFLEDVLERGRSGYVIGDAETQPHGLTVAVVRVLPQDHGLDLIQWGQFEGFENLAARREDLRA